MDDTSLRRRGLHLAPRRRHQADGENRKYSDFVSHRSIPPPACWRTALQVARDPPIGYPSSYTYLSPCLSAHCPYLGNCLFALKVATVGPTVPLASICDLKIPPTSRPLSTITNARTDVLKRVPDCV